MSVVPSEESGLERAEEPLGSWKGRGHGAELSKERVPLVEGEPEVWLGKESGAWGG